MADERLARLGQAGINLADVTARLEAEGVTKFAASYEGLLRAIESKMEALALK
jgi:transaldolase